MKKLYIIEVDESDIVECWNERAVKEIGYQEYALKQCPKIKVRPYNYSGDCISREQIRKSLNEAFGCENATKYGNQNAEQQNVSYSTLMLYEIADIVDDCCDNALTVQPERQKGEWIKEDNGKTTDLYRCSICERSIMLCKNADLSKYPFCHCGADMRKGGAE